MPQTVKLVECSSKASFLNRLEQVVDTVDFKGTHGVLVVGGGKDDRAVYLDRAPQVEAVTVGQLDIAEDEVGVRPIGEGCAGTGERVAAEDDLRFGTCRGQQLLEPALGRWLVLDDPDLKRGHRHRIGQAAAAARRCRR